MMRCAPHAGFAPGWVWFDLTQVDFAATESMAAPKTLACPLLAGLTGLTENPRVSGVGLVWFDLTQVDFAATESMADGFDLTQVDFAGV